MSVAPDPSPRLERRPSPPRHRVLRLALSLFTLEIGLFLLIFPWRDSWNSNYIQDLLPMLDAVWPNSYFRGAVSGLGLVNIYLAVLEFSHFLRRSS